MDSFRKAVKAAMMGGRFYLHHRKRLGGGKEPRYNKISEMLGYARPTIIKVGDDASSTEPEPRKTKRTTRLT